MVGLEKATADQLSLAHYTERLRRQNRYGAGRTLTDYVLQAIPTIGIPRPCREICADVRDEYGRVSQRQVNRALAKLLYEGRVVYVRDGGARDWGYIKQRRRGA